MRALIIAICFLLLMTMAYAQERVIMKDHIGQKFYTHSYLLEKYSDSILEINDKYNFSFYLAGRSFSLNNAQIPLNTIIDSTGKIDYHVTNQLPARVADAVFGFRINVPPGTPIEHRTQSCTGTVCRNMNINEQTPNQNLIIIGKEITWDYSDIIKQGFVYNGTSQTATSYTIQFNFGALEVGQNVTIDPTFSATTAESTDWCPYNASAGCLVWCDETDDDIEMACYGVNGEVLRSEVNLDEQLASCGAWNRVVECETWGDHNISVIYHDATDQDVTVITGNWTTMDNATTPKWDIDTGAGTQGVAVDLCRLTPNSMAYTYLDDGSTTEAAITGVYNRSGTLYGALQTLSSGDQNSFNNNQVWNDCYNSTHWVNGWSNTLLGNTLTRVANVSGVTVGLATGITQIDPGTQATPKSCGSIINSSYNWVVWTEANGDDLFGEVRDSSGNLVGSGDILLASDIDTTATNPLDCFGTSNGNFTLFYEDSVNGAAPGNAYTGTVLQTFNRALTQVGMYNFSVTGVAYGSINGGKNSSIMHCDGNYVLSSDLELWNASKQNYLNWTGSCGSPIVSTHFCDGFIGGPCGCATRGECTLSSDCLEVLPTCLDGNMTLKPNIKFKLEAPILMVGNFYSRGEFICTQVAGQCFNNR